MESPWLHRYAVFVALCALAVLATGAILTNYDDGPRPSALIEHGHPWAAAVLSVLILGLALWLSLGSQPARLRYLGWFTFGIVLVEGGLGSAPALVALPHMISVVHAFLAQLIFAASAAIALFTSPGWTRGQEPVKDHGWPSLKSLSTFTLLLVLVQISMGAAFRHKASGVMPHIAGAMVVALTILILCMFVMQQFPEHRVLRPAANALLAVAVVQVFLGIAALTMRMLTTQNTPMVTVSTVSHVAIGALTLAASAVIAIQIRRHVRPKGE